jgi:hypothetical protein
MKPKHHQEYYRLIYLIIFMCTFIPNVEAQTPNDTIYYTPIRQWFVSFYLITDTMTGASQKVIVQSYTLPMQYYAFDSLNCVLKIEAHRIFPLKKKVAYFIPSTANGRYLWLYVFKGEVDAELYPKRWGII